MPAARRIRLGTVSPWSLSVVKLDADLLDDIGCEFAGIIPRYVLAVTVLVLAEPIPGERSHDQRGLVAVTAYRGIVRREIMNRPRDAIGANEPVQVAIDIIVNDAFDDVRVEMVGQSAEFLR